MAATRTLLAAFVALFALSLPGRAEGIIVAGDIAGCNTSGDSETARLIRNRPGQMVATLGDNVYPAGAYSDFTACYDPTWGTFKQRTRPSPGNHDYATAGAAGYMQYFFGGAYRPYYAYNEGENRSWRVYSLNSEIPHGADSAQLAWLKRDLTAHPRRCVLAYWHRPRFSSGPHADDSSLRAIWRTLYRARADVVLSGHDHDYERFARQRPDGVKARSGIRQFVVGTGGRSLYDFAAVKPNSQRRYNATFGVLRLKLFSGSYSWRFIPTSGSWTDTGSTACSQAPS